MKTITLQQLNDLSLTYEQFGLKESEAQLIKDKFTPVIKQWDKIKNEFEKVNALEITKDNIKEFKSMRNKVAKIRAQFINKAHKESKDYYLQGGRFVDSIKNTLNEIIQFKEDELREKEEYFEKKEKERIERLQIERVERIKDYIEDAELLDLSSMDDDVFEAYFIAKKKAYDDKIKAEKKAEQEEKERLEKERIQNLVYKIKSCESIDELNKLGLRENDMNLSEIKEVCFETSKKIKENERIKLEAKELKKQQELEKRKIQEYDKVKNEIQKLTLKDFDNYKPILEILEFYKLSDFSWMLNQKLENLKAREEIKKQQELEKKRLEDEEKKRKQQEKIEKERQEELRKAKEETKRIKREQEEKERLEKERLEKERLEKERLEKEQDYKDWLKKNEGKFDKIVKENGKIVLYKIIDEYYI